MSQLWCHDNRKWENDRGKHEIQREEWYLPYTVSMVEPFWICTGVPKSASTEIVSPINLWNASTSQHQKQHTLNLVGEISFLHPIFTNRCNFEGKTKKVELRFQMKSNRNHDRQLHLLFLLIPTPHCKLDGTSGEEKGHAGPSQGEPNCSLARILLAHMCPDPA